MYKKNRNTQTSYLRTTILISILYSTFTSTSANSATNNYYAIEEAHKALIRVATRGVFFKEVLTATGETLAYPVNGLHYARVGPSDLGKDPRETKRKWHVLPFSPYTWTKFTKEFHQVPHGDVWNPKDILKSLRVLTLTVPGNNRTPKWPTQEEIDTWKTQRIQSLEAEENTLYGNFKKPGSPTDVTPPFHTENVDAPNPEHAHFNQISLSAQFERTMANSLTDLGL